VVLLELGDSVVLDGADLGAVERSDEASVGELLEDVFDRSGRGAGLRVQRQGGPSRGRLRRAR
jgi:hypothetical protein